MTEEQQSTLRRLHDDLQVGKFRSLSEPKQLATLKKLEELLFSQSMPMIAMTDRRRLRNLVAPITFANVSEEVASAAKELTERWDKAPF